MPTKLHSLLLPILLLSPFSASAQDTPMGEGWTEGQRINGATVYLNDAAVKAKQAHRARVAARTGDPARWLDYEDDVDIITRVDRESLQVEGLRLRAQLRNDFYVRLAARPDIAYSVLLTEYDCAEGSIRVHWGKGYDDQGALVFEESDKRGAVPVRPGTRGELYHRRMCALREELAGRTEPARTGR